MGEGGKKQSGGTAEADSGAGAALHEDSVATKGPDVTFGNWTAEQKAAFRERLARQREGYDYAELVKYHELPRLTRIQAYKDLTMIHGVISSFQDKHCFESRASRPSEFLVLLRKRLDMAAGRRGRD